jgi:membrane protein
LLRTTFEEWNADNAARLAAALAYYTIFSIAPLLVIVVAVAGLFYGREAAQGQLLGEIERYVTDRDAAQLIETAVENARVPTTSAFATAVGFVLLFWGATGVFGELRNALNNIWDVPPRTDAGLRGVLVHHLLTVVMVAVGGFLLLLSLVASAALSAATDWINIWWPGMATWTQVINFVFLFFVTLLIFLLIYKFVPDVHIAWRDVWAGAIATALLFSLGRLLIGWYLGRSTIASAYGAASSLAIMLLYTYYSAQMFFLGAEFTQVYGRTFGSRRVEHQLIETPLPAEPQQTDETPSGQIVPVENAASATDAVVATSAIDEPPPPPADDHATSGGRAALAGRLRRLGRPLGQVGAALGVIALLSVVNLVVAPLRRPDRKQPSPVSQQQA